MYLLRALNGITTSLKRNNHKIADWLTYKLIQVHAQINIISVSCATEVVRGLFVIS